MAFNVDNLVHKLQHHNTSFSLAALDLTNPYQKTMSHIHGFTDRIIDSLKNNDANIIDQTIRIYGLYADIPSFSNIEQVSIWIKRATLVHPLRRTALQSVWLLIASLQACTEPRHSVSDILHQAISASVGAIKRVYAEVNLQSDPDALYFHRYCNGLVTILPGNDADLDPNCTICTDPFNQNSRAPRKALCGHVHCRKCIESWLEECPDHYVCPQCRACLICGRNNCTYHPIIRDIMAPIPLLECIEDWRDDVLAPGAPLPALTPHFRLVLRERTREDRAMLRYSELQADNFAAAGQVEAWEMERRNGHELVSTIWEKIAAAVQESAVFVEEEAAAAEAMAL